MRGGEMLALDEEASCCVGQANTAWEALAAMSLSILGGSPPQYHRPSSSKWRSKVAAPTRMMA
jgi:hypothetical protein